MTNGRQPIILVSGAAQPRPEDTSAAEKVGRLLAAAGSIVLTGGGAGVMEAASRGARAAGGTTVAVLPGSSARESPPNPHVLIPIYSGMGNGRNAILVRSAEAVIAIGGGWGTLSEIALACNLDRPVVLLGSWQISPPDPALGSMPVQARDAQDAVERALHAARSS